ncbi:Uncharacterised protein [Candidatus Tiddalikarchaeum anstoanum]|nr:Uncharacterised protein [Candidatus Tiddalikarchaeum anstoanum]
MVFYNNKEIITNEHDLAYLKYFDWFLSLSSDKLKNLNVLFKKS